LPTGRDITFGKEPLIGVRTDEIWGAIKPKAVKVGYQRSLRTSVENHSQTPCINSLSRNWVGVGGSGATGTSWPSVEDSSEVELDGAELTTVLTGRAALALNECDLVPTDEKPGA
jgi:hypothetical protein